MRALTIALATLLWAGHAGAQSGVACTSGTTAGLFSFGNYIPTSPVGVSALLGEFVIRCANVDNQARNVRLRLAISAGSSGTASRRQMVRAGAPTPLLYNLFEDAAYTVVWTADTGGRPDEFLNIPARSTTELRRPIFGRIPGSQTGVSVGLYSDTLLAIVRY